MQTEARACVGAHACELNVFGPARDCFEEEPSSRHRSRLKGLLLLPTRSAAARHAAQAGRTKMQTRCACAHCQRGCRRDYPKPVQPKWLQPGAAVSGRADETDRCCRSNLTAADNYHKSRRRRRSGGLISPALTAGHDKGPITEPAERSSSAREPIERPGSAAGQRVRRPGPTVVIGSGAAAALRKGFEKRCFRTGRPAGRIVTRPLSNKRPSKHRRLLRKAEEQVRCGGFGRGMKELRPISRSPGNHWLSRLKCSRSRQ